MKYEGLTGKDVEFKDIINWKWTKVLFASYNQKELQKALEFAQSLPFKGTYLLKTAPVFFELTSKAARKGNALKKLAEHLGIKPDKVFAVGDFYNDIDMLQTAGISALTKEAPNDIKKFADYIT